MESNPVHLPSPAFLLLPPDTSSGRWCLEEGKKEKQKIRNIEGRWPEQASKTNFSYFVTALLLSCSHTLTYLFCVIAIQVCPSGLYLSVPLASGTEEGWRGKEQSLEHIAQLPRGESTEEGPG